MGFSIVVSHVLMRIDTGKFPSLTGKEKFSLISDMSSKFNKPSKTRISQCKSEMVDFDERRSLDENLRNKVISSVSLWWSLSLRTSNHGILLLATLSLSEDVPFLAAIEVHMVLQLQCVSRLGRGVVYLGSSRMGPGHSHYLQALELGREVANLLDCTSWTGAGPGLMDAATKGALEAGKPVGGFKIAKEAGEWTASNFHSYLPSETYLTCRFFSARKHGLVDAAVRSTSSDRTAVVALPGGIGTLDEMFEILTLIQLQRIGSEFPVPFLVMNYDSYYQKLLDFLGDCEDWGTVSKGEVGSLWKICENNSEALAYLTDFYALPSSGEERHEVRLQAKTE
ncbi:unnamed protein product [Dovyalis caffra]|uniref:Cytokinin riboside 5'-monophosphate phosphoribohydrolase n=1 Tax=Dovyalis caffra TaxID=77055 RepID=A0AAV1SJ99_9ROSI|nr:unnamed protein product [Dovyalis caffra]